MSFITKKIDKLGFQEHHIKSQKELRILEETFKPNGVEWIFRGVSDGTWSLETSLERAVLDLGTGVVPKDAADRRIY